jgi:hypothetical protein
MVVGFEILMVVLIESNISWDMRLCSKGGVIKVSQKSL